MALAYSSVGNLEYFDIVCFSLVLYFLIRNVQVCCAAAHEMQCLPLLEEKRLAKKESVSQAVQLSQSRKHVHKAPETALGANILSLNLQQVTNLSTLRPLGPLITLLNH